MNYEALIQYIRGRLEVYEQIGSENPIEVAAMYELRAIINKYEELCET